MNIENSTTGNINATQSTVQESVQAALNDVQNAVTQGTDVSKVMDLAQKSIKDMETTANPFGLSVSDSNTKLYQKQATEILNSFKTELKNTINQDFSNK